MKTFLLISFFFFHFIWAQFETMAATERLYYRGAINDVEFQLELRFDGDNITGSGYDEQGNALSLTGTGNTETNTIALTDGYRSYLGAFTFDYETQTYLLSGVRIDGANNEPFNLRLIATYNSAAFKAGSLESTILYPLWLGNYEIFNQFGDASLQNYMVSLAYNFFNAQQNSVSKPETEYPSEPFSRRSVAEIHFASPDLVSMLIEEEEDYLGAGLPLQSITMIAENGTARWLELPEVVSDTSILLEGITERLESETDNENISLTEEALKIFTLSPTGITFHIAADVIDIPFSFENSFKVTLSFAELEGINPSILELVQ